MLDRESTFANKTIVNFLKTKTIPVAIDQAYQRRQKDTEGEFYRKIVQQSPRKNFENSTTQGLYMACADGTFLGFTNNRSPEQVARMLQNASDQHRPTDTAPLTAERVDRQFNPQLEDGGLVVRVQAKILEGYDAPETKFQQIMQNSLSRDNLWVTSAEHRALAAGNVPRALGIRIARYHLVDSTRGEPPMWESSEVRHAEFSVEDGMLLGRVDLKTKSGDRSYICDIRGQLEVEDDVITKWNMVALGTFSGEGRYTKNAPKKPFPLAVSFTLADGSDMADRIPPQASRGWLDGYLKPAN